MLTIDNQALSKLDWLKRYGSMERLEGYRDPEGKRYAVCLENAFDVLTVVLFLRERGGSLLLIHTDTPAARAAEFAVRADCAYLIMGNWDTLYPLEPRRKDYAPTLLQLSSGTTGSPKLIARSWTQIETEIDSYNEWFRSSPGEQPVILAPVSHSFGLITGVLAAWARGSEPAVVQGRNLRLAARIVRETERPLLYTVPFVYSVMDALERGRLQCHKVVLSGSPPSAGLLDRLRDVTDEIWQQYGSTETGCISVSKQPASPFDVGMPLRHHEIWIRPDDAAADRSRPEQGEIIVRTNAADMPTGDLGYVDALTGRLQLIGRLDDLIDVGGLLVAPAEVEAVIRAMPGVRDSVVVKTKHKVWGEAVKALVVAEPPAAEQDVRMWCIDRLPAYQVPSVIEMVAEIPRMPSGKVSRKSIYEQELISG
jgi:3,4-dihydroxybenzoate---[aryl-carrier protein] ligase